LGEEVVAQVGGEAHGLVARSKAPEFRKTEASGIEDEQEEDRD
jgi:hypothetical protein